MRVWYYETVFQQLLKFGGDNGRIHTDNSFALVNHGHAYNVGIGNRQTSVIALNAPSIDLVLRISFAIRKNYFVLLSLLASILIMEDILRAVKLTT